MFGAMGGMTASQPTGFGANAATSPTSPFSAQIIPQQGSMGMGMPQASPAAASVATATPATPAVPGAAPATPATPAAPALAPPVDVQRNQITQALMGQASPELPPAPPAPSPVAAMGGGASTAPVTPMAPAAPAATRGPLPDYSGQAARLQSGFAGMGLGGLMNQPHQLDQMGSAAMAGGGRVDY